jgi:hypothetical protein
MGACGCFSCSAVGAPNVCGARRASPPGRADESW